MDVTDALLVWFGFQIRCVVWRTNNNNNNADDDNNNINNNNADDDDDNNNNKVIGRFRRLKARYNLKKHIQCANLSQMQAKLHSKLYPELYHKVQR